MVVTAQPFLNEIELLLVKFAELEGEVDAHIIVEADRTFTGSSKPMLFAENKDRFTRWNIIYRAIELPVGGEDPWMREELQYNAMRSVIAEIAPKICLWLDADEIPRAGVVQRFLDEGKSGMTMEMDYLMYDFEHWNSRQPWHNAKIGYYHKDIPQLWRGSNGVPVIKDAGWHAEYMGGDEVLAMKLQSTSHAVEPEVKFFLKSVLEGKKPGIEFTSPYPKERCPRLIREQWGVGVNFRQ